MTHTFVGVISRTKDAPHHLSEPVTWSIFQYWLSYKLLFTRTGASHSRSLNLQTPN